MKLMTCLVLTSLVTPLWATPQEADKKQNASPETVTAVARPLVVYGKQDGLVVAPKYAEIELESNGWADFEIDYVINQGVAVKAGEKLVSFDTEGIVKALRDMEMAQQDLEMDLAGKRLAAEQANKRFEMARAIAQQTMKNAEEDYQYYLEVERPERLKDLDYSLRMSEYSLEYAREELEQLMQMYNEDELTEDSERIVLKRAQRSVESAERSLAKRRESIQQTREVSIPREDFAQKNGVEQQALEFAKTMLELPNEKVKADTALRKAEIAVKEGAQKLQELRDDQKLMVLTAPMDGIVYYGRCVDGKWTGLSGTAKRSLEIGKKVPADKVVMTIVDPNSLVVRSALPEEKLAHFEVGDVGKAVLKSDRQVVLPVKLTSIDKVPAGDGTFGCLFSVVDFANGDQKALPGMNCTVSVKLVSAADAIMVPRASVFSDNEIDHYVYSAAGKKQPVQLGFEQGDQVQVVSGLKAGAKIRQSKP
ncbi:MAG: HlyD family efflux transporter periplasmic adaptor subunit [Planctomycetota bacterium]|nr:HlyD family efflux transporter periplasmic adaptor subunit [Planctomycetota bacterium]